MEDPQQTSNQQRTQNPSQERNFPSNMFQKLKGNLGYRSTWPEINGAMGDLGTYIPIVLALTLAKDLDLGTTLIFTGIYNIVTGAVYGIPMPVQPMKSIAAVAIANPDFNIPEIMAAGICTGGILFFLGVSRLMALVYRFLPLPIVRGIQLSQGLSFAMSAVKYIRKRQDFAKSKSVGDRGWLGLDGLLLAIICACFVIIVNGAGEERRNCSHNNDADDGCCDLGGGGRGRNGNTNSSRNSHGINVWRRVLFSIPSAFIVFLLGVLLAIVRDPDSVNHFKFGPSPIRILSISKQSWKKGFIDGTIPQLPLSVLNSVIAVCKLSSDLFPEKAFTATSISVSVGMMNLVGCWFGAMPCCHGAGGLAGQYKFGGRSGACVAMLGVSKMVVGVILGSSIVKILDGYPVGVLGVLLLFAGIELAMAARDMNTKEDAFVMLLVTAVSQVSSGAALGFLAGIVSYVLLRLRFLDSCSLFSRLWTQRDDGS